jgi:hypothetical protein
VLASLLLRFQGRKAAVTQELENLGSILYTTPTPAQKPFPAPFSHATLEVAKYISTFMIVVRYNCWLSSPCLLPQALHDVHGWRAGSRLCCNCAPTSSNITMQYTQSCSGAEAIPPFHSHSVPPLSFHSLGMQVHAKRSPSCISRAIATDTGVPACRYHSSRYV